MYYSVYSLNNEVVKGETPVRNLSSKIQNIKHQKTLEEARSHRLIKERNEIRDKLVNVYLPIRPPGMFTLRNAVNQVSAVR